jgi:hypothetical protein
MEQPRRKAIDRPLRTRTVLERLNTRSIIITNLLPHSKTNTRRDGSSVGRLDETPERHEQPRRSKQLER